MSPNSPWLLKDFHPVFSVMSTRIRTLVRDTTPLRVRRVYLSGRTSSWFRGRESEVTPVSVVGRWLWLNSRCTHSRESSPRRYEVDSVGFTVTYLGRDGLRRVWYLNIMFIYYQLQRSMILRLGKVVHLHFIKNNDLLSLCNSVSQRVISLRQD